MAFDTDELNQLRQLFKENNEALKTVFRADMKELREELRSEIKSSNQRVIDELKEYIRENNQEIIVGVADYVSKEFATKDELKAVKSDVKKLKLKLAN